MTIDEIAKLAGVSKTTVSRVINDKPDVNPETREAILGLIAKYDFQPNAFAKAMTSQKSQHVGLLIPHDAAYVFSNPFYVEVMRGVSTEVNNRGYYLLICYPHEDNYVNIYKQKRVDGFIIMSPGSFHKNIINYLRKVKAPFVTTSKVLGYNDIPYVDIDNFSAAETTIEHLISLGHSRIAYIGKPTLTSSIDRLNGYKSALKKHGIQIDDTLIKVVEDSPFVKSGYNAMLEFIRSDNCPSAVFLSNDVMAIGAINAAKENGIRVPEDISIVGFDDIPFSRYIDPSLTTVRQPAFEKGVEATKMLIENLEKKTKLKSVILEHQLVIRKSTCEASKKKI